MWVRGRAYLLVCVSWYTCVFNLTVVLLKHLCVRCDWQWLWSPCVADADIIFLPVVSSLYLSSICFLAYSQPSQIGCLPYTSTHGVVLGEFRMQVWNVLHAARWKYRTQNIAKNSPSGHHRTNLSGYILATKARIDNRENFLRQQYVLHMSP